MLVLTRRLGESIIIGTDIEVKVVKLQGDSVRLAISAPRGVEIMRKEIVDAVKSENKKASQIAIADIAGLEKLFEDSERNDDAGRCESDGNSSSGDA